MLYSKFRKNIWKIMKIHRAPRLPVVYCCHKAIRLSLSRLLFLWLKINQRSTLNFYIICGFYCVPCNSSQYLDCAKQKFVPFSVQIILSLIKENIALRNQKKEPINSLERGTTVVEKLSNFLEYCSDLSQACSHRMKLL